MKKAIVTLLILAAVFGYARTRTLSAGKSAPSDTGATLEDTLKLARPSDTGGKYAPQPVAAQGGATYYLIPFTFSSKPAPKSCGCS